MKIIHRVKMNKNDTRICIYRIRKGKIRKEMRKYGIEPRSLDLIVIRFDDTQTSLNSSRVRSPFIQLYI